MRSEKKVISVPAAVQELCVSPGKIKAWIKTGELPAANLARDRNGRPRYAISRDDLAEFLRGRRVVPDAGESGTRRLRRSTPGSVKEFFYPLQ